MYATYEEYTEQGGSMSAEDFARFGAAASRYIDEMTFDRAANAPPDMVPRLSGCCCELAELLRQKQELSDRTNGGLLTAANNDGYSESYADAGRRHAELDGEMLRSCRYWLGYPVNLLYAGVI